VIGNIVEISAAALAAVLYILDIFGRACFCARLSIVEHIVVGDIVVGDIVIGFDKD
jgi:hypothetical protein